MKTNDTKVAITLNSLMDRPDIKARFQKMLGDRAGAFLTSVNQVVASSDLLKHADPMSILNGAATAATLNLTLNNSLGLAYLIPFNVKQKDGSTKVVAQFVIGYKGILQLAQRSGQYKNIAATPIYQGQLVDDNPLTGYKFDFKKKSNKIIGYAAYFSLMSGFEKTIYWTIEEVHAHAKKYSKTYGKSGSAWATDEEDMCNKTVLKQLIGKYGPMSVDYQKADAIDEEIYDDLANEKSQIVDTIYEETDEERKKLIEAIDKANTAEDLAVLKMQIGADDYLDLQNDIDKKIEKINSEKKK